MNWVHFVVWIHYVAVSLWDLWEAGQVSLAEPSPFAVCLFSQPHRRQIEPPVCSPLQSHQCNQTSAAINHRLWTLCPARCHIHTHTHGNTILSTQIQTNECKCGLAHESGFARASVDTSCKRTNMKNSAVTLAHTRTHLCTRWHILYASTRSLKWGVECLVVVLHKLRLSAQGA